MKIIKQNDSAGGLIFKQNTGGKAMKQNYDFGKAWRSYNPGSAYIDINKVIPPNTAFSIGFFSKSVGAGGAGDFIISDLLPSNKLRFQNTNSTNRNYITYNQVEASLSGLDVPTTFLFSLVFNNINASYLSASNVLTPITTNKLTETINKITLKRTGLSDGRYSKVDGLFIYDRAITQEELVYRKNNRLGNELLNINGLWAEYPLSGAEILNIGGSDFVGVRDISGNNRHIPILSLPVGDLESQLAWANTNCFEIW